MDPVLLEASSDLLSDSGLARINLKNHPLAELLPRLVPLGVPEKQARQLMARVISQNLPIEGLRGL